MAFVEAQYGGPVLDGACGLAVSPDGRQVYAAGYYNGVVGVFSRTGDTGELTLLEIQREGVDGVDGLDDALDVTVSPDGLSVYAVGEWDNGLAVFSRDSDTGRLTFLEVHKDDVNGVDGLGGASAVVVSPDNRYVYTAGWLDDGVAVFSRDTTTGRLTFVEALTYETEGIMGLGGACALTFSPEGDQLYAVGCFEDALAVFSRNTDTGRLTFLEAHMDDTDGVDGLGGAYSVSASPDGRHVYVAGEFDDAVAVFSRDDTTGRLTFAGAVFDGVEGVEGLAGANDIAVSPDGGHVYVSGYFLDALAVFSRDPVTGALSFLQWLQDDVDGADGLYGARSVAVSSDGSHVYVSGEYDNAIGVYARNSESGLVTFVEMQQDRYEQAEGLYNVTDVTVSPDGGHLYAAGYEDDSVAVFRRSSSTGALTFIEVQKDGVNGVDGLCRVSAVILSPDGNHLYAAGYYDDAVAVFRRNPQTGGLTFLEVHKDGIGGIDGLDGARSLAVSPDGLHVYVGGYADDAVAVFVRNITSGALTFSRTVRDGSDGVDGLDGVRALVVSADGRYLYAAGNSDDAVAVFSRSTDTGDLVFVEQQKDSINGVDGLNGVRALALDPDGGYLYAAGHYDDAVAVFSRDADTGRLTFVEIQENNVGSVRGLNGVCDLSVSPDGSRLYAAGYYDSSLSVFARDPATGRLSFEERQQDGEGGVDGLKAASAVALSPDGDHVYAAGQYDSAVAVFSSDGGNDDSDDSGATTSSGSGSSGGCFIGLLPSFGTTDSIANEIGTK